MSLKAKIQILNSTYDIMLYCVKKERKKKYFLQTSIFLNFCPDKCDYKKNKIFICVLATGCNFKQLHQSMDMYVSLEKLLVGHVYEMLVKTRHFYRRMAHAGQKFGGKTEILVRVWVCLSHIEL